MTPRDAKEFLIGCILAQAERDGVSLAEPERKMLYFSQTGWVPPETAAGSEELDGHFEEQEFERKIKGVIRNARQAAEDSGGGETWEKAVEVLRWEDHYLPRLIDLASKPLSARQFARVILISSVIIAAVVLVIVAVFRGQLR